MHSLRQKHSAAPRATYFTCALLLYSITREPVQKILTQNINDTKLNNPSQILHFMIRILYEVVLAENFGNKMCFGKKVKKVPLARAMIGGLVLILKYIFY